MIKKFKKFLYLLSNAKLEFKNPPEEKLIIFDDTSIEDLKHILFKRKYFILNVRINRVKTIYVSFKIIFFFLKYFNSNLFSSYLIALIKVIKPKVVMTIIDNSYKFHEIAKLLDREKINFIGLQNAARYDLETNNLLFKKKLTIKNHNDSFFIPQFVCFGDYVEKEYRKNKIKIGKYFKFGSLRLSNYISFLKEKKIKIKKNSFDIAFVSGYSFNKDKIYNEHGIDHAWAKMCIYTIRFCMKNRLKFVFVAKAFTKIYKEKELNFFKKYLTKHEFEYLKKRILPHNAKKYISYKAIHESNVVTGVVSTMLQDKLALNGKVFVCNFTNHNTWDFPIKNFCFLKKPNYQNFEKRLSMILNLSNKRYFNFINKKKLIYLNKKKLTHQLINKHLDKLIKIQSS